MRHAICVVWTVFSLVATCSAEPLRIVTLGDSITKGVRAGVAEDQTFAAELQRQLRAAQFPDAEVINVGIGGEQAGQGLARLARDVVAKQPSIVTIMYGHNDSYIDAGKTTVRVSIPRFRADISQLVERLREAGITPILMTPPAYSKKSAPNGAGEHCNVKLSRYAEVIRQQSETLQVPLVDHFAAWEEFSKKGADLNEWTTDGYHPNRSGHVDLATRMHETIKIMRPKYPNPLYEDWPELPVNSGIPGRRYQSIAFQSVPEGTRELRLPRLNNVVLQLRWHSNHGTVSSDGIHLTQTPREWTITLPDQLPDQSRVQIIVDGMPRYAKAPAVSRPGPDGVITLSARDAVVYGEKLQFEPLSHKNTVGYWVNPNDYAEWSYEVDEPSEFDVEILQGCGGHAGSDVELSFPDGVVPFIVEETGHFQNFVWRKIGKIALKEPGVQVMSLKCKKLAKGAVMDMRQIRLTPRGLQVPQVRDMRDVEPDLVSPYEGFGATATPGQRVGVSTPAQSNLGDAKLPINLSYSLYLPTNWSRNRKWPILVEWTGNGLYRNDQGDLCTGLAHDAQLGVGLSGGYDAICLSLPFLNDDGSIGVRQWWGDSPKNDPAPTLKVLKHAIAETCEKYHGDPDRVILVGFSRGSIAVNAIGLSSDEAAGLWKAAVCFSHYDGVREWPFAKSDAASALTRLQRLGNRPQFIISESAVAGPAQVEQTRAYLEKTGVKGNWTFAETGFINHDDRWALRPSPARQQIREWLKTQMQ